jgi:hypothetical protein
MGGDFQHAPTHKHRLGKTILQLPAAACSEANSNWLCMSKQLTMCMGCLYGTKASLQPSQCVLLNGCSANPNPSSPPPHPLNCYHTTRPLLHAVRTLPKKAQTTLPVGGWRPPHHHMTMSTHNLEGTLKTPTLHTPPLHTDKPPRRTPHVYYNLCCAAQCDCV